MPKHGEKRRYRQDKRMVRPTEQHPCHEHSGDTFAGIEKQRSRPE
jgi:hypothetical protein